MAGVAGWASDGGSWGPSTMATAFHEALGISFQSADPQKCMDTLLYGLTMAWGTEVTSFNLSRDAAAVSFAICNVVSKEPARSRGKKYACSPPSEKATPKKGQQLEKGSRMALDDEAGIRCM